MRRMRVRVRLFAGLRERAGRGELELDDLPEGADLAALKRELARRHPALGGPGALAHARGVLGTEYVGDEAPVADGALVFLLPPVSGGADDVEAGVFELSPGPIDVEAVAARVADVRCGALVTFVGATRSRSRGREVLLLEYEAFEAMSGPEMARIFADCRERCRADGGERMLRMACAHRVGIVELGQPSVVIAVASPHRGLAFEGCRFLIDELKARLPVWKKERYAGGEEWIGEHS
jgi:molybdopterin synthase catalytic subunit